MTGMGGSEIGNSWNGAGTTGPSPSGKTCNDDHQRSDDYEFCYADCDGGCANNCWWTTCNDSVGQVVAVLDTILDNYCVDLEMIWTTGCSNGGHFLHELAHDARIAPYLAGVAPQVATPHPGFNFGPISPMSYMGIFGIKDRVDPPLARYQDDGTYNKDIASERHGRLYATSEATTAKWSEVLGCSEDNDTKID